MVFHRWPMNCPYAASRFRIARFGPPRPLTTSANGLGVWVLRIVGPPNVEGAGQGAARLDDSGFYALFDFFSGLEPSPCSLKQKVRPRVHFS